MTEIVFANGKNQIGKENDNADETKENTWSNVAK